MEGDVCRVGAVLHRRDCQGNSGRNPGSETGDVRGEGLALCFKRGLCGGAAEVRRARSQGLVLVVAEAGVAISACTWTGGGVMTGPGELFALGPGRQEQGYHRRCGDQRGSGGKQD